jgi:hypothetical protein
MVLVELVDCLLVAVFVQSLGMLTDKHDRIEWYGAWLVKVDLSSSHLYYLPHHDHNCGKVVLNWEVCTDSKSTLNERVERRNSALDCSEVLYPGIYRYILLSILGR